MKKTNKNERFIFDVYVCSSAPEHEISVISQEWTPCRRPYGFDAWKHAWPGIPGLKRLLQIMRPFMQEHNEYGATGCSLQGPSCLSTQGRSVVSFLVDA